jgi:hypothetical protein
LGFQYTFIKKVKGSIKSVLDLNNWFQIEKRFQEGD